MKHIELYLIFSIVFIQINLGFRNRKTQNENWKIDLEIKPENVKDENRSITNSITKESKNNSFLKIQILV